MSAPILRFAASFYWNGSLVCHAVTTATMAADQARDFIRGNFAGPQIAHYVNGLTFMGDALEALTPLQIKDIGWGDKTGTAQVVITRL